MQSAVEVIRNLGLNSRIVLHRLGNVLGEPLQVVALKTKICCLIRLNLCHRQACPGSHCILVAALLKKTRY